MIPRSPLAVLTAALGLLIPGAAGLLLAFEQRALASLFGHFALLVAIFSFLAVLFAAAFAIDALHWMDVERDLISGRSALAWWRAPDDAVRLALPRASARARTIACLAVGGFLAACVGLAISRPGWRADMLELAAMVAALGLWLAFMNWIARGEPPAARRGVVIVGEKGALLSGRLLVWTAPMVSLVGARDEPEASRIVVTIRGELRRGHFDRDFPIPYPATEARRIPALVARLDALVAR